MILHSFPFCFSLSSKKCYICSKKTLHSYTKLENRCIHSQNFCFPTRNLVFAHKSLKWRFLSFPLPVLCSLAKVSQGNTNLLQKNAKVIKCRFSSHPILFTSPVIETEYKTFLEECFHVLVSKSFFLSSHFSPF